MLNLLHTVQTMAQSTSLAKWASSFLVLILAWLSGILISAQLQPIEIPPLPEPSSQVQSVSPSPQGKESYLFGKPEVEMVAPSQSAAADLAPEAVAATRLRLKLIGAIATADKGVAIIESSGTTLVVAEGEQVINGVDLVKVYSDQAVILHRGKHEKLQMEEATAGLISTVGGDESAVSDELTPEHKQTLREIGEVLRQQPVSISKYIRFQPINQNGQWTAVKIWPKEQQAVFEALGFKAGDLLKSVNGRSIQDLAQEPALWQTFLNESQFELTVERNGQPVNLTVDLN